MKKQRNYILLAFLIPVIITVLFSCTVQKYGCPKAKQGDWHGRKNITIVTDKPPVPDCVDARETNSVNSK